MEKFCIDVISATPNPQQVVWAAMHQDYSEHYVWDSHEKWPDESRCGELIVKHLLAGERGHYGPIEHRYTGQRIVNVAEGKQDVEEVFYLRPVGNYTNRQGKRYFYSEEQRAEDMKWCLEACHHYKKRIEEGLSEEHARGLIPFDARQHFVLSCNMRSLMHLLDLRWKKDAQLEAQKFCELLFVHFEKWAPDVAQWYKENRAQRAKLSP
jgi:thymidylate synthase (FAD)